MQSESKQGEEMKILDFGVVEKDGMDIREKTKQLGCTDAIRLTTSEIEELVDGNRVVARSWLGNPYLMEVIDDGE